MLGPEYDLSYDCKKKSHKCNKRFNKGGKKEEDSSAFDFFGAKTNKKDPPHKNR